MSFLNSHRSVIQICNTLPMEKVFLKSVLISAVVLLGGCGGSSSTTSTESNDDEVQVTQAPSTTVSEDYWTMTSSEGIEWIRDNAPSLASSSDSELYSVMSSACDMIISWAPDYDGWLEVFIENVSKKSTEDRSNMMAVVVAATRSNCTEHLEEVLAALDKS